jgi:hypothetical protein
MQHTTATRTQVLAAYRADPTVTVRDLQARFGVGRNTVSRWLREEGLSRPTGNRKGAAVGRQVEVEDDFKAVLLGWYGEGAFRRFLTALSEVDAYANERDPSTATNWHLDNPMAKAFTISSPAAAALVDRAVGKSWRKIALDLLLEDHPTGSPDPALLRRAESDAVDLKRKVQRRLDALADDPTYREAVEMFTTHWMHRRPAWMRSPRGRSQTGLDNRTK